MILSFIQWKGAAFLALGIILNAIVVSRIYSNTTATISITKVTIIVEMIVFFFIWNPP